MLFRTEVPCARCRIGLFFVFCPKSDFFRLHEMWSRGLFWHFLALLWRKIQNQSMGRAFAADFGQKNKKLWRREQGNFYAVTCHLCGMTSNTGYWFWEFLMYGSLPVVGAVHKPAFARSVVRRSVGPPTQQKHTLLCMIYKCWGQPVIHCSAVVFELCNCLCL